MSSSFLSIKSTLLQPYSMNPICQSSFVVQKDYCWHIPITYSSLCCISFFLHSSIYAALHILFSILTATLIESNWRIVRSRLIVERFFIARSLLASREHVLQTATGHMDSHIKYMCSYTFCNKEKTWKWDRDEWHSWYYLLFEIRRIFASTK